MDNSFPYLTADQRIQFPDPGPASRDAPVCYGANLSPGVLLSAYEQGLFPWFSQGDPLLWWCPDPRFVLFPESLRISSRLRRYMKSSSWRITVDHSFEQIIRLCRSTRTHTGTWITDEMLDAYVHLHTLGVAHSIEVWEGGSLVGGLYGVHTGRVFSGESMVSLKPNSSKFSLVYLTRILPRLGGVVIDAQMETPHIRALGGEYISRKTFLGLVHTESTVHGSGGAINRSAELPGEDWSYWEDREITVPELLT
ncbi:leucyl/phenylalanyl-tRNA--protein transferase [Spirochaeta lutea]|uniref:leucyl/phenylalanyl-tRNA--protein transferase n=1 Tax=Spirochaeta lutea TaxID=1480694 RepID=UPI0009DE6C7C|nr:leucyl/phenylalanyl-tRNA--protein transferase [Spirochaeta lutea]